MSSSSIIKARGVSKSYSIGHADPRPSTLKEAVATFGHRRRRSGTTERFQALKDVSFDVPPGERMGIIGANGAGKSTLLKILCQVTLPESGTIEVTGTIGSLLEVGTGFHPELTGRENVFLNGAILGLTRREISRRFDEIVDFAGVERFLDTPVKRYSSGMHVRLGFAVAAHLEPDILIVDEVLAVGDAAFQRKCIGKLDEVARNHGRAIVFVSHSQAAVQELCSRVLLLEDGAVAFDGPMKEGLLNYLDLQDQEQTSTGHWDLSRRHNGNHSAGTPLITSMWVEQDGRTTADLLLDQGATICMQVQGLPEGRDPWVGVRVTTDLGQALATFISPLRKGRSTARDVVARLLVPRLPFAPGNYRLDVGVVDVSADRVLDELRGAGVLSLRHPEMASEDYVSKFGNGLVAVPAKWTLKND